MFCAHPSPTLDFPLPLLFNIRMLVSEIVVWTIAIIVNIVSILYFAEYYETTRLTALQQVTLSLPYPYWNVILLSAAGSFLSIRFADEMMDVIHHLDREFFHSKRFIHETIIIMFFVLIFIGYYEIIALLGIDLEL